MKARGSSFSIRVGIYVCGVSGILLTHSFQFQFYAVIGWLQSLTDSQFDFLSERGAAVK